MDITGRFPLFSNCTRWKNFLTFKKKWSVPKLTFCSDKSSRTASEISQNVYRPCYSVVEGLGYVSRYRQSDGQNLTIVLPDVPVKRKRKLSLFDRKNATPVSTLDINMHTSNYYCKDGFRFVHPYFFAFSTFAKLDWIGKKLIETSGFEFNWPPRTYRNFLISEGLLLVNKKQIDFDYEVKHNDHFTFFLHRHENPVLDLPIEVIFSDGNILVVNKPPSIPVHSGTFYRFNSLTYTLAKLYGLNNLMPVHRLDKVTSGVQIFAKNIETAHKFHLSMKFRLPKKFYVALVSGDFPSGEVVCDKPLMDPYSAYTKKPFGSSNSGKLREAETHFQRIGGSGRTSVVLCRPITGRTHQIRMHLCHLGFPIVNDAIYNEDFALRKSKKNSEFFSDTQFQNLIETFCSNLLKESMERKALNRSDNWSELQLRNKDDSTKKEYYYNHCIECNIPTPKYYSQNMFLCLHSLYYEIEDYKFKTELPYWASQPHLFEYSNEKIKDMIISQIKCRIRKNCSNSLLANIRQSHFYENNKHKLSCILSFLYSSTCVVTPVLGIGNVFRTKQNNGQIVSVILPDMISTNKKRRYQNIPYNKMTRSDGDIEYNAPFFNTQMKSTCYYKKDGLMFVYPYFFIYSTFAKYFWIGLTMDEVVNFPQSWIPPDFLNLMIRKGFYRVNFEEVDLNYKIKENDFLTYLGHRHEDPILDLPIKFVFEDDNLLVVDKPPSFPIHPVSFFRYNSLGYLLAGEHGYYNLRPINRLDKMTSGVVIFAKDKITANSFKSYMQERQVEKIYLALVMGNFPDKVFCNEPVSKNVHKNQFITAETYFEKISTVNGCSIILCKPITGRTHQIRKHLQILGHPIINDYDYNPNLSNLAWKPLHLKSKEINQYMEVLKKISDDDECDSFIYDNNSVKHRYCIQCHIDLTHIDKNKMFLCLHAWEYKVGKYHFKTELPYWATDVDNFLTNFNLEYKKN